MQPQVYGVSAQVLGATEAGELRALYTLTDRLYRATSLEDVYAAALDAIIGTLGCGRASILLFDEQGVMRFVAWRGLSAHYRQTLAGHSPWKPGDCDPEPILVPDILESAEPDWVKSVIVAEDIRSLGFVPIVADGAVVGKFMTYYAAPHAFHRHEVELATAIARQVGFSVQRARAERRRRQAEEELRESEERFRLLAELAPAMIWMGDPAGDCLHLNGALREFWGVPPEGTEAAPFDWRATVHPDDRDQVLGPLLAAMQAGEPVRVKGRMRDASGAYRVIETAARPRFSPRREFLGMIGVNIDVTEREAAASHRELMLAELGHRMKNTLAVVQALARQTFRQADPGEAAAAFEGRLTALAAAHDLLTGTAWDNAPLARLAADVLRLDGTEGQRVTLSGPAVQLPQKQVVALTLALHELLTNALKHGALSSEKGRVLLEWREVADPDPHLAIRWIESGGPPVSPPSRRGFGSTLIERALTHDCDASVELAYPEAGLTCTIALPLPAVG